MKSTLLHASFWIVLAAGFPLTSMRMELFIQVCEGVQHAHQKAIIHRDLKPSNILVTEIDGKPMPRIIDFGVAKATSQKLTAGTMYTRFGTMIGTIGYMSPEQADPIGEDIDTRTDVYSLGAVLYELLTGVQPLNLEKLGYDQVLRILRDQDVLRPSTKVTTLGGDSAIAAKNRSSDPPTLVHQLRGDPDAIALKALEKDRARRYASASELADDIGRYLRNEPVRAHPPSIGYRSRKYLRRHRLGLAVAASAVMSIALLFTLWRIPPAVPVVESVVQLTDDGQPKGSPFSIGSRVYFNEGAWGSQKIAQVSVKGGPITRVETDLVNVELLGGARDGSGLLIRVRNHPFSSRDQPMWWISLPTGEPHRLGDLNVVNADVLSDGRIVFGKTTLGVDAKSTDDKTEWFIADNDGSNSRKLVSVPGRAGEVWAATGKGRRVLFSQEFKSDRRLFEIRADGTGLREIKRLNDNEDSFVWTSDEKYLVYQFGKADQSNIWLLPMKTGLLRRPGKPIPLTNGPIPYSDPCPSQDGKQIFVLGTKQRGELIRYDMRSHEFTPFLSGISATDPTFSRDGKWVAYISYPDRILWRSRTDGTERKQLTYLPIQVLFPSISPDGTKVAFSTDKAELFVISLEGGPAQRIDEKGIGPSWSPDGNYLYYQIGVPSGGGGVIADLRSGMKSRVPSSEHKLGSWLTQDSLITSNSAWTKFQIFDLNNWKWSDLDLGRLPDKTLGALNATVSPDGRFLYFITGGTDPSLFRLRLSDQRLETITSLKDFSFVSREVKSLNIAPDGSPVFTRDTGSQEIYALNIRWP
jgi:serine/threonine protein kinase/Tol biopolymer transport system component